MTFRVNRDILLSKKLNSGSPAKRSVSDLAPVCYGAVTAGRDAVRKLKTLPPMQQSLCVGFVLGAGATENTKKDEKEVG